MNNPPKFCVGDIVEMYLPAGYHNWTTDHPCHGLLGVITEVKEDRFYHDGYGYLTSFDSADTPVVWLSTRFIKGEALFTI
jgi:hypothetical protein